MPDAGVGEKSDRLVNRPAECSKTSKSFVAQESATAKLGLPPAHSR